MIRDGLRSEHDCGPCPAVPLHGGSHRPHALRGCIARPMGEPLTPSQERYQQDGERIRERAARRYAENREARKAQMLAYWHSRKAAQA